MKKLVLALGLAVVLCMGCDDGGSDSNSSLPLLALAGGASGITFTYHYTTDSDGQQTVDQFTIKNNSSSTWTGTMWVRSLSSCAVSPTNTYSLSLTAGESKTYTRGPGSQVYGEVTHDIEVRIFDSTWDGVNMFDFEKSISLDRLVNCP